MSELGSGSFSIWCFNSHVATGTSAKRGTWCTTPNSHLHSIQPPHRSCLSSPLFASRIPIFAGLPDEISAEDDPLVSLLPQPAHPLALQTFFLQPTSNSAWPMLCPLGRLYPAYGVQSTLGYHTSLVTDCSNDQAGQAPFGGELPEGNTLGEGLADGVSGMNGGLFMPSDFPGFTGLEGSRLDQRHPREGATSDVHNHLKNP
jgi:hypothetical protein